MQDPMNRLRPALLLASIWAAIGLGCADRPEPPGRSTAGEAAPGAGEPAPAIAVRDDAGRVIRLAAPPRRVVSLAPSHTEIVFALGAGDRLVGRTPACDHPPAAAAVPPVGNLFPPDYERIIGAAPELVLMLDGQVDVRRRLEGHGLAVAVIQPRTLADVAGALRTVGRLLGVDPEPVAARFEAELAAASRPVGPDAPRVFYEVGSDPLFGAGPAGFVGDLIRRAGARNALSGQTEWPQVSTEQLIVGAPDLIVVGGVARQDAVRQAPPAGWAALPAVKRGRVLAVPDADLFNRPGPRVIEGLRWMAAEVAREPSGSTQ